ncbi:DapH/DapD/GlmU-related protein [Planctomycetota bacterium]
MTKTQVIHPSAEVGAGTTLGEFVVIEEDVSVGKNCVIGHHAVLRQGTCLGDNIQIGEYSVIGKQPMVAAISAMTKSKELPIAEIGDETIIGSSVIIYRGCRIGKRVLVADAASVREEVNIGDETIIGRSVTIENKTKVGTKCKIQTNAYICALSEIGDGCFVAPCVAFTNDNFLGRTKERFKYHKGVVMHRGARIGANATILPGITIGEDGLVGAGSVVTHDVPARKIVIGSPARVVKDVSPAQLLENQQ